MEKLSNDEKCTYCREYGNLPCDECDKKLNEKIKNMSRLEELYQKMVDEAPVNFHHAQRAYIMELAGIYATESIKASLENASKNGLVKHSFPGNSETSKAIGDGNQVFTVDEESITNPENIVLL